MIRKKQQKSEIIIDLTGPDGNAFALMAYAKRFARQLGWNAEEIDELIEKMTSGDYENLLQVFDLYFGSFVILER
jgi:alanine-alpha-ketoisovalerate/valine-pyruvate aminotransferase